MKLPQLWRALAPSSLIDKLWLGFAAKIFPVGAGIPWFSDVAPNGFAIMKNQAYDMVANPELAKIWPNGIIPDMRGCGVIGKEDGESVGVFEEGHVKSHGHPNSTVASTNIGNKATSQDGEHIHQQPAPRGYYSNGGNGMGGLSGTNPVQNWPTSSGGKHMHITAIGAHAHTVAIALFGGLKNTINHRKVNWIVRMA
ncbi:phage tail protein [Vibrio ordalii FF-167]|nr:phage tail protein [Vibrio ordalii FF-167]